MRRHRRRMAVVAATSTVVMLSSGIAAAAGGLPGAAQSTAKTVLGIIGVSVPGPNGHAGSHPNTRGHSGDSHGPAAQPNTPADPGPRANPSHPITPAGTSTVPTSRPTPGNSGVSRHHGNPTPSSTTQPTPGHGKPTAAPTVSRRRGASTRHAHPQLPAPVMQRYRPAISR